jgi:hypothetical protein
MNRARAVEILNRLRSTGVDPAHPDMPLYEVVLRRMHDAQRGHPGSSMGGGGKGNGGSPIEAMLAGRDDEPSSAVFAQRDIGGEALRDWHTAYANRDLEALDRLALAWTPRQPSASALRATAASNVRLCEHCHGADVRSDTPTDCGGRLAERLRLCTDCYRFESRHGRLPSPKERERIARGGRVRDRVITANRG